MQHLIQTPRVQYPLGPLQESVGVGLGDARAYCLAQWAKFTLDQT